MYLVTGQKECVTHLLVLVFLCDLIYGNLQRDIVVAGMTAVLIDPELGGCDRLALWDLGQIEAELLVVSPLVRKIFVFLDWERKLFTVNEFFTGSKSQSEGDFTSCVLLKGETKAATLRREKG